MHLNYLNYPIDMTTHYSPEIRFADLDAMGHVNNATFFTYFEQARMHYFRHALNRPWDWDTAGIIVVRNEADYRVPVFLHDQLQIRVTCTHIGSKSLTMEYAVTKAGDASQVLCATGKSVLVSYNHQLKCSIAVPEAWKALLGHTY